MLTPTGRTPIIARRMSKLLVSFVSALFLLAAAVASAGSAGGPAVASKAPGKATKFEDFGSDPGWTGVNNRHPDSDAREQHFHYRDDDFSGLPNDRVGGTFRQSYTLSYYARPIDSINLDTPFEARGRFKASDVEANAARIGFFNSDSGSVNDTPLPNSFHMVIGDVRDSNDDDKISVEMEFTTAGGSRYSLFALDQDKRDDEEDNDLDNDGVTEYETNDQVRSPDGAKEYDLDETHTWELRNKPGDGPYGTLELQVDNQKPIQVRLPEFMRKEGATFDLFGLTNHAHTESGSAEVDYADITVLGNSQGDDNLRDWVCSRCDSDVSNSVRPAVFDFGYLPFAPLNGLAGGLLTAPERHGGDVGDYLDDNSAFYADRLPRPLDFDTPLRAKGTIYINYNSQDMESFIGFFNEDSYQADKGGDSNGADGEMSQFIGFKLEGEGGRLQQVGRPSYGSKDLAEDTSDRGDTSSAILDGPFDPGPSIGALAPTHMAISPALPHRFKFKYDPEGAGGRGELALRVDGGSWRTLAMKPEARSHDAVLEFFGMHSADAANIARAYQYMDDVTYTVRAPGGPR